MNSPGSRSMQVKAGDTMTSIATRNGVSVAELLALNPQIRNPDRIGVGDLIRLPETGVAPTRTTAGNVSVQATGSEQRAAQQPALPVAPGQGAAGPEAPARACACRRDLSIDELAAIFPSRSKGQLTPFLAPINAMMEAYHIDTCLRKVHALAQIGHESGSLRYVAEILRAGKTEQGAYGGYKGRGLIQITFEANYRAYGAYKGMDFLGDNRLKLETPEYAADSAGWFWNHGAAYPLSPFADKNDLILISAAINGGFNGFDDRAAIFARAHKALKATNCAMMNNRSPNYLRFDQSSAYDMRDMAFAWGFWSDPKTNRQGLSKDGTASKAGYRRFLELIETDPGKRPRYGFATTSAMTQHAKERSS